LVLQAIVWVAMIATLLVMRQQLLTMQQASVGQNTLALIDFIQAPDIRKARTIVRVDLRDKDFNQWTPEEKRNADIVCSNYDVLAVLLLQQKLAPMDPFIENWGPSICDCFKILENYVHHMQSPNRSGPDYWDDFVQLHQLASLHKSKKNIKNRHVPPKI
jgi:hypothetical protein